MKGIIVNKKGFTLIELIVAITILGIITVLALPSIRNIQEKNSTKKYETYQKSLISSAKLYVDSYSEDMFGVNKSGCYDISYGELKDKKLVKDINVPDIACNGVSAAKQTFIRVYRSIDSYTYKAEVYCKDKNNNVVYENTFERGTEVCDGTTEDKAGPSISFSPNELGYDEQTNLKAVYVYIKDSYGLEANQKFSYQWYDFQTKQPIGDSATAELDNNKHTDADPVTSAHLKVNLPSGTGQYYLKVHPISIRDVNGNYTYDDATSGNYKRDKEAPTLIIKAYRKSGKTKTGDVLAQATANNADRTADLNIDWVNYSEGIYFEIEYSDNVAVSKKEWSVSGVSRGVVAIPEDELRASSEYINAEGKTTAYYKVIDIAGNSSKINITVSIDKSAPKVPTVKLYKWSNNSTMPTSESGLSSYTAGSWSNKKVYTKVSGSTTETSGTIYYQYTTTGATTNVTDKTGSTRNIEAQGTSTIKYRACDQLGNCSAYTDPITINVDYTKPELKVHAYKRTSEGTASLGAPITSVTANNSNPEVTLSDYSNTKNGWLNKSYYANGVYYQITYTDNISVKARQWYYNNAGLQSTSSNVNVITNTAGVKNINSSAGAEVSDYVTLEADGYRKAYFIVKDKAGNSTKVNIIAPIDTKSPTCKTSGGSRTWTNTSRTLTGTCSSDALSGCASGKSSQTFSTSTLTASPPNIYDKAGNSGACPNADVYVDTQAPYSPTLENVTALKSNTTINSWSCQTVGGHKECIAYVTCQSNTGLCEYSLSHSTADNLSGVKEWYAKFSADGAGATTGCSSWTTDPKCYNTTSGTGASYSTHYYCAKDNAGNIDYNLYLKVHTIWSYN